MKKVIGFIAVAALIYSSALMAEFDQSKAYVGGGLAYNSPDGSASDSMIGYQGFVGYDLNDLVSIHEKVGFSVEAGYATSGDFCSTVDFGLGLGSQSFCGGSSDGIWTTAVFDYKVKEKIKAIGRIGYDLANINGLIIGAGGQYELNSQMSVVAEYVIRNFHKGLQANFIYHL